MRLVGSVLNKFQDFDAFTSSAELVGMVQEWKQACEFLATLGGLRHWHEVCGAFFKRYVSLLVLSVSFRFCLLAKFKIMFNSTISKHDDYTPMRGEL